MYQYSFSCNIKRKVDVKDKHYMNANINIYRKVGIVTWSDMEGFNKIHNGKTRADK